MPRVILSSLVATCSLLAQSQATPPAQSQTQQAEQRIIVQVNEVVVPVTVTDSKGLFVSDLEEKDFRIFDEGKEQKIRFFTRERNQPVVVGFLIDQSNSSRMHWKNYMDAATELVLTLLPGQEKFSGYLIGYSNEAEILQNTTHLPEKLTEKIAKMKPGGGSALYDAIYQACTKRELVKGEPIEPRRVLIIIGDGHDNASKHNLNEVLELAQRNLVTIYCVSTVGFGFNNESDKTLVRLAEETGGRPEYPLQGIYSDVAGFLSQPSDEGNYAIKVGTGGYATAIANNVFKAIQNIAGEVTTQYILRYVPEIQDTGKDASKQIRNIEVRVSLANVKVRARKYYYPSLP